ncbi:MAG: Sec-independent protein translocase protein TatB [Gammaproteobacteria bacterium]
MFDVSFGELALIGVVALLVVGPQKLPGLARGIGLWVGKTRRMIASVRADVDREFKTDELRKLLTEQQEEMRELRHILDENRGAVETDLRQLSSELNTPAQPAGAGSPSTLAASGTSPSVLAAPASNALLPDPAGPTVAPPREDPDGRTR